MSDASYYRNYCMKAPRPAMVRVYAGDDVHDIGTTEDQNWARLGETISALDPDRIELYSADETLLRADKRKTANGRASVAVPGILSNDPETARLTHFADLIHRAYEHTTEVAFTRLLDMMQMQTDRHAATERRLERMERQYFETLHENVALQNEAAAADDEADGLLKPFLEGMASAKTNGSHEKGQA